MKEAHGRGRGHTAEEGGRAGKNHERERKE
jgi:hypothetical protein